MGLRQSRGRVWMTVIRKSILDRAGVDPDTWLKEPKPVPFQPQRCLRDYLNLALPNCTEARTQKQQLNLVDYMVT